MPKQQITTRGQAKSTDFGFSKKVIGVLAVSLLALSGVVGFSHEGKASGAPTTPCIWTEEVPAPDGGGLIRISTPGQLKSLSVSQDSFRSTPPHILITADINLGADCLWTPLGAGANFEGVFDGGGFSITNLYVNTSSSTAGFFSSVSGGLLKNLTLSGSVSGTSNVGGLAGQVSSTTITNVRSEVNVSATGQNSGGLAGAVSASSTVQESSSTGTVSSSSSVVGGLIGRVTASIVSKSFSTSNVTSSLNASPTMGGFVGDISSSSSVIDCYSTGQVVSTRSNTQRLGGFVGQTATNSSITNSYHAGTVSSAATTEIDLENAGLFVGNHSSTVISASLARSDAAHSLGTNRKFRGLGSSTLTNSRTETTEGMRTQSTFTALGWDFENVWVMSESANSTFQGFPVFKWQGLPSGGSSDDAPSGSSSGFSAPPQTTITPSGANLTVNLNKTRVLRLSGANLNLVTEARVAGKKATINFGASNSGNLVISKLPLLPSGKYTLTLLTPTGLVAGEVEVVKVAKITRLRAIDSSGKLNAKVRSVVRKQNLTYGTAGTLRCWGVTTGSSAADLALAKQKAEAACAYAKKRNPELDVVASARTGTGKPARNQVVKLRYLK